MSGIPTNVVAANGVAVITDAQANTYVQTDATIAQLRGFVGIASMAVLLQGSAAPGDGGGGLFCWNAGSFADDGVNTIVPTAAQGQGGWLRAPLANPSAVIPAGSTAYLLGATGTQNLAGLVAVGTGLALNGGTLESTAEGEWNAGTVDFLSDLLAITNGTLSLAGAALHQQFVLSIPGTLFPNTQYWTLPISDGVTVPAGWVTPDSVGACTTPAVGAATELTVAFVRGGITTEMGTVVFDVGATAAILSGPTADISLFFGDVLTVSTGPAVDGALANVGFTLAAVKA